MKDYKDYKKAVKLIKKATRSTTFEIQSIKKLSESYIVVVIQNNNKREFFVNLKENACMPI
ncbi:MAG: hypothetical protein ACP5IZ_11780 [Thermoprotei archaeon]|jgi:hypothetical protein